MDDGRIFMAAGGSTEDLLGVAELPIAMGGAARHNVSNALAAALVARALGFDTREIASGLEAFTGDPQHNPGRGNLFDLGGATILVDFAHNPHGLRALFEMASRLPAKRRLVLLGQAGDRDDESIRSLVKETWKAKPDRIVIKEMMHDVDPVERYELIAGNAARIYGLERIAPAKDGATSPKARSKNGTKAKAKARAR